MRSLEQNTLKKNAQKKPNELFDEMQLTKPKQTSLNSESGSFGSVFDSEKSLNLADSVFNRTAVFKTKP